MASNTLSGAGVTPANTKAQLLHIGTGTAGAATIRTGAGAATVIDLVTGGVKINGTHEVTGRLKVGGLSMDPAPGVAEVGTVLESVRVALLASDHANSTVTLAEISGFSFPVVENGLYRIEALIPTMSAATTTGARFQLDGPSGVTWVSARWNQCVIAGLTAGTSDHVHNIRAFGTLFSPATAPEASQPYLTKLDGLVKISASVPSAELKISFASEVAASAVTVLGGSMFRLTRLA